MDSSQGTARAGASHQKLAQGWSRLSLEPVGQTGLAMPEFDVRPLENEILNACSVMCPIRGDLFSWV